MAPSNSYLLILIPTMDRTHQLPRRNYRNDSKLLPRFFEKTKQTTMTIKHDGFHLAVS
jgi:hypothetical protein